VSPQQPLLRVVKGAPDDDELAALVTVVAALAGRSSPAATAHSLWRDRGRNIRPPIGPGPGSWRASGLPR
jgi:hypothetical protein